MFAAVALKRDVPICTRVVDEVGDSILFSEFVGVCINEGIVRRGDILVLDNCTIHIKADNDCLQDVLLMEHGVLMLTLPPYYPELNPTELVFRCLVTRMRSLRCRSSYNLEFLDSVRNVLDSISFRAVACWFDECGYF